MWQPTQKDLITQRNLQANTDKIYVDIGAIRDVQGTICQSRFGGDTYSFETSLSEHEDEEDYVSSAMKQEQELADKQNKAALAASKGAKSE